MINFKNEWSFFCIVIHLFGTFLQAQELFVRLLQNPNPTFLD